MSTVATGGDLVDEGIAAFTGEAAGQTGIEHPIPPEVAELDLSRRTRVYISAHPPAGRSSYRAATRPRGGVPRQHRWRPAVRRARRRMRAERWVVHRGAAWTAYVPAAARWPGVPGNT
ncbi:MAG: hypothetical protein ACRDTC_09490, partial [Pseudonocardiaceae bacterium]